MGVRQLICWCSLTLFLSCMTNIAIGADADSNNKNWQSNLHRSFNAIVIKIKTMAIKLKQKIVAIYNQLNARKKLAEQRRLLQKQQKQKMQDLEYLNSHQQQ